MFTLLLSKIFQELFVKVELAGNPLIKPEIFSRLWFQRKICLGLRCLIEPIKEMMEMKDA